MIPKSKIRKSVRKISISNVSRSIGAQIQALRERKAWKQSDLARATGFDPGFVSYVEAGKKLPSVESLVKFALALRVTPATLLSIPEFHQLERQIAHKRGAKLGDKDFYENVGRLVYGRFLASQK